jgi:hypothetical protein
MLAMTNDSSRKREREKTVFFMDMCNGLSLHRVQVNGKKNIDIVILTCSFPSIHQSQTRFIVPVWNKNINTRNQKRIYPVEKKKLLLTDLITLVSQCYYQWLICFLLKMRRYVIEKRNKIYWTFYLSLLLDID